MADHADSEDDEELKLAIALSLQAANSPAYGGFGSTILSNPPTARREDIEDEGDDDLKLAIELSLQAATSPARDGFESSTESYPPTPNREATPGIDRKAMAGRGSNRKSTSGTASQASNSAPSSQKQAATVPPTSTMSALGLDRKKMELERLARMENRTKRALSGSHGEVAKGSSPSAKRQKVDFGTTQPLISTATTPISPPLRSSSRDASKKVEIKNGQTTSVCPTIQYPSGTIKRTYSKYHERENDIKIEEVLLKDQLRLAVLSSFQWDNEWLATKVNFFKTKVVLVAAAKTEEDRYVMTQEANANRGAGIQMCFPPMEGEVHCMHSKLMLLSYTDSMRIVVPSANLVPYDWGETGVMENSVFLIDLPRLKEPQSRDDLTYFGKELLYFLEKSEMPEFVIRGILNFDFSATESIGFVHSVGGPSFDGDLTRTGFNGLARTVRKLGLATKDRLEIEYAISSVGSLTASYLNILIQAAHGISTNSQTRLKTNISDSSKMKDHFRLYFPTLETVLASRGGPMNAGSVCFLEDWYNKPTFPKEVFRDHLSTRRQLLSHNKIMLAHTPSNQTVWAYMGSHNMSESAWGKIVRDSKRKENKLVCRNWECGVLLPVSKPGPSLSARETATELRNKVGVPLSGLFRGYLDVPFEIPAPSHGDREPWFFQKDRS